MRILKFFSLILFIILLMIIVFWAIFPSISPTWTGFGPYEQSQGPRSKTLWDWFELLIIPLILAVGIWWLNIQDKESKDRVEIDRQNHDTLEKYLDCMTTLLLKDDLRNPKTNSETIKIARIRTLSVLRSVDGSKKGQILQFLYESGLIFENPIINLNGADFTNALLVGANLQNAEIRGVIFINADFTDANLTNCKLQGCNFTGAIFSKCTFEKTDLSQTLFNNTNCSNIDLRSSCVWAMTFDNAKTINVRLLQQQDKDIGSMRKINRKGLIYEE